MKFITNSVKTGSGKSFDDIIRDFQNRHQVKTASVKVAEQEEADSSGQLDVEPLHQKGESTEMPKKGPSAKKEDCDKKKEAKTVEQDKEGEDSEQPKWEGKKENVNDPEEPTEKGGSSSKGTKKAAIEDLPQEVQDKIKGEKADDTDDTDDTEEKEETKEASEKRFVKIANLDAKNKEFLRKYWTKLYGADYVNALLADK